MYEYCVRSLNPCPFTNSWGGQGSVGCVSCIRHKKFCASTLLGIGWMPGN